MASEPYDDILKKARELPADEQEKLIMELARSAAGQKNGDGTTLGERMEARGLLGVADGPADLSTNPKHMEGFCSDGH
jgi:hypothetical protein